MKSLSMKTARLGNTGMKISNIGIGTSGLSGLHGDINEEEAVKSVLHAIECGVNFIDTSPYYYNRRAEIALGEILASFDRSSLCICTKVGRYMDVEAGTEAFDYSAASTIQSVKESLKCMKLSYLDLVLIHDVEYADGLQQIQEETIPSLVYLQNQGLVRSIGVSGYSTRHLRKVVESCPEVEVIMSYFRHNLYDNSLLQDLEFYSKNNIGVINASPLAIGLLTNKGSVPVWNPASPEVKSACCKAAKYCSSNDVELAKLALRYSVETPGISMTLWSSCQLEHMKMNITYASTPLTLKERDLLEKIRNEILKPVQNSHWEEKLNKYHSFWKIVD